MKRHTIALLTLCLAGGLVGCRDLKVMLANNSGGDIDVYQFRGADAIDGAMSAGSSESHVQLKDAQRAPLWPFHSTVIIKGGRRFIYGELNRGLSGPDVIEVAGPSHYLIHAELRSDMRIYALKAGKESGRPALVPQPQRYPIDPATEGNGTTQTAQDPIPPHLGAGGG